MHDSNGSISQTPVHELLRGIEQAASDARIWFETDSGLGEVLFHQGRMVKARLGGARAQTALLRLLDITEGRYGIEPCSVAESAPIISSVSNLLEFHDARKVEWKDLCNRAPPMGSILRLTAAGAEVRDSARGIQRVILGLMDSRRTLMQVLEESSFDPIETLRIVTRALDDALAQIAPQANSLFPPAPASEDSGTAHGLANLRIEPVKESPSALTDMNTGSWRHSTLVGMGVKVRKPELPTALAAPIIDVGGRSPVGVRPEGNSRVNTVIFGFGSQTRSAALRDYQSSEAPRQRIVDITSAEPSQAAKAPTTSFTSPAGAPVVSGPSHGADSQRRFVDRYEILLRIGRGDTGTVYLARLSSAEVGFRRLYALKLLRSHLSQDEQASKDFLEEARVAGYLHHANIVSVYDAGFHGKQPYLVMDYVEGCSLQQLTRGLANRSPFFLLPIIMDALAGLQAAHLVQDESGTDLHLVHCNVTPENMLVGVDGICRLTDFGMAYRASRLLGNTRSKAEYVAPERLTGKAFDHRTDLYSIGVVLWNALTGRRLFDGETTEDTIAQVCNKQIVPPSALGAQSSPELDALVMRALSSNPNDRFDSAEELLSQLRCAAANQGGLANPKEIAAWVRETAGAELTQQRLAILDASRNNPTIPPPTAELSQTSDAPAGPTRTVARADRSFNLQVAPRSAAPKVRQGHFPQLNDAGAMSSAEMPLPSETGVTSFFYGVDDYESRLLPSKRPVSEREAKHARRQPAGLAAWLKKPWTLVAGLAFVVILVLLVLAQTRPQRSVVGGDMDHSSRPAR